MVDVVISGAPVRAGIGEALVRAYARRGAAVTLVERRERPLEFLDREIVDELDEAFRAMRVAAMREPRPD